MVPTTKPWGCGREEAIDIQENEVLLKNLLLLLQQHKGTTYGVVTNTAVLQWCAMCSKYLHVPIISGCDIKTLPLCCFSLFLRVIIHASRVPAVQGFDHQVQGSGRILLPPWYMYVVCPAAGQPGSVIRCGSARAFHIHCVLALQRSTWVHCRLNPHSHVDVVQKRQCAFSMRSQRNWVISTGS